MLITVGMQLRFDRRINAMNGIVPSQNLGVIVQTGKSADLPYNMKSHKRIAPAGFAKLFQQYDLIVNHAGIGIILIALWAGRQVVIVPRLFENGGHRNNHQVATARNLTGRDGLLIATGESEL